MRRAERLFRAITFAMRGAPLHADTRCAPPPRMRVIFHAFTPRCFSASPDYFDACITHDATLIVAMMPPPLIDFLMLR